MRAVGGADLAQLATGARHDPGNAERAADFDQLAARDNHFPARGQRVEHQQHRGRVVVHHGRGLGAGEFAQQLLDVAVAVAAFALAEIEFKVAGLRHDRLHRRHRLRRQQRAAEVGVQHRAGEIEHAPQRRAEGRDQALTERLGQRRLLHGFHGQRDAVALGSAQLGQQRANGLNEGGVPVLHTQWHDRGQIQHAIDSREYCSRLRILHLDQGRFRV